MRCLGSDLVFSHARDPGSWMSIKMSAGCLVGQTHALFTGLGHGSLATLDLQRVPYQLQVVRVVFNDEDRAPES